MVIASSVAISPGVMDGESAADPVPVASGRPRHRRRCRRCGVMVGSSGGPTRSLRRKAEPGLDRMFDRPEIDHSLLDGSARIDETGDASTARISSPRSSTPT